MATVRVETPGEKPAVVRAPMARVPFGGFNYKLEVANKDPSFFYYWQKDVGDNLERMQRAGYEFVTRKQAGRELPESLTNRDLYGAKESLDDRLCVHGGRDEYGKEYKLYLMRQPMEFHEEDARRDAERADLIDQSIRRQTFGSSTIANKYGSVDMSTRSEE
jgi:hypothetical protein